MEHANLIKFSIYWIVNASVLNLSASVLSNNVHLGNAYIRGSIAAFVIGLLLTALYYQIPAINKRFKFKIKAENQRMAVLFISNAVVLWVIKALATITGLGISSIFVVLIVAVFVTSGQLLTERIWSTLEKENFTFLTKP